MGAVIYSLRKNFNALTHQGHYMLYTTLNCQITSFPYQLHNFTSTRMTKEVVGGSEVFHDVQLEPSDEERNSQGVDQDEISDYSCPHITRVIMTPQYVPGRGLSRYNAALKHLIPLRKNKK